MADKLIIWATWIILRAFYDKLWDKNNWVFNTYARATRRLRYKMQLSIEEWDRSFSQHCEYHRKRIIKGE